MDGSPLTPQEAVASVARRVRSLEADGLNRDVAMRSRGAGIRDAGRASFGRTTDHVRIYDTTLRDGCQAAGITLSLHDKVDLAHRLDRLGVDYVEGGWPGSNPKDRAFFAAMRERPLQGARLACFGSTRKPGLAAQDDANLRLLVEADTPAVAIVAKSWDLHVRAVLRTTLQENLAMVADSVRYLKAHGREVIVDAEHFFDGARANPDYARAVLRVAVRAGADWVVLCDTNGGSLPDDVERMAADVVAELGPRVGIHAHNDGELAVANSLAAVRAGARQVHGTLNGYGERAGNASLCSLIPNLTLKLGLPCRAAGQLRTLTQLSRHLDALAGVEPNPRLPFVGAAAFAHKGGLHVQAIALDPATYEHITPQAVGNERRILVSELSGRGNVAERARQLGIDLAGKDDAIAAVLGQLKRLEHEGWRFEDAEASFELLVRRALPGHTDPFEVRQARVTAGVPHGAAEARVEVVAGGRKVRGRGTAPDRARAVQEALRQALVAVHPAAGQVEVAACSTTSIDGSSVRARVEGVLADGSRWATVAVAEDTEQATCRAVADGFQHALVRAGSTSVRRARRPDTLDIASAADRRLAARAVAAGAPMFYAFGNFYALASEPSRETVVSINRMKGRPDDQPGSVTTTRKLAPRMFDWNRLPRGLDRARVLALIDDLLALGPMGFRGPAAGHIPSHLRVGATVQLIAPGPACPSNALIADALSLLGRDHLFVTSANTSSRVTGRTEPAHFESAAIDEEFGGWPGVVLIGHSDETAVRAAYPGHLPGSTSILDFHALGRRHGDRPALALERHGSQHADNIRAVLARHGFALALGPQAQERLPVRTLARAA